MATLRDIGWFRPAKMPDLSNSLSNAQIAQIMVRRGEVLSDPSSIDRTIATVAGVRELRKRAASAINSGLISEHSMFLDLLRSTIGMAEEHMVDFEFD